ncbi:MAG: hypothetical protein HQK55_13370 [Deltaproteobacteria bacterium]|nr:hypothetical protein [Deltaproteobacteria bacterium]
MAKGRRYIVSHNEKQTRKDQADREAIVAFAEKLNQGNKALGGNAGYRKYLKIRDQRFEINRRKVEEDARYAGKWVLRTSLENLSAAELALEYKRLWME